ncbi:unnamed protein product [Vitrella brassicaformis CCMP3155]|uniref:Uncharacterized protein n=1 Tax=Vitrella brassicaformis (strain CCMP3155) TaxID=1169540 RepID=A0A0G4FRM7_VITBC|nr:unnamed protein product [Vitrella brassicaformis CCMP3155]|mmetsp:Transcript_24224/g.69856  ORF Transcript_24224/g.69856 Transcript_24224/m.69856 type:complete len:102 (+) Transcript_24224:159-464(+)|eukprot:CEM17302.1 unnamed protein product [Vitrella brassicaformis CCMP3155]
MCPKCSQLCVLIERIPKASGSLVADPFGGPLRDVTVHQADAQGGFTMADSTWKASYYSATIKDHCLPMIATQSIKSSPWWVNTDTPQGAGCSGVAESDDCP